MHFGFSDKESKHGFSGWQKSKTVEIGLAPALRYYFDISRSGHVKFLTFAAMQVVYYKYNYDYQSFPDEKGTDLLWRSSFGLGLAYFGPKISADVHVSNAGLFVGVHKQIHLKK